MRRSKRFLAAMLMVLSLGFLMGDDCEIEIEDLPGWIGGYFYRPYDYVIVEDVYYDDYWW